MWRPSGDLWCVRWVGLQGTGTSVLEHLGLRTSRDVEHSEKADHHRLPCLCVPQVVRLLHLQVVSLNLTVRGKAFLNQLDQVLLLLLWDIPLLSEVAVDGVVLPHGLELDVSVSV